MIVALPGLLPVLWRRITCAQKAAPKEQRSPDVPTSLSVTGFASQCRRPKKHNMKPPPLTDQRCIFSGWCHRSPSSFLPGALGPFALSSKRTQRQKGKLLRHPQWWSHSSIVRRFVSELLPRMRHAHRQPAKLRNGSPSLSSSG